MSMKTILIVEDDESLMSIFRMALELDGHQVIEAGNGKIALDLLLRMDAAALPDCILLDIMMPVMDGHIFLKLISRKFKKRFCHIPVIVCSAHGKHEMTSQVATKIIKPVSLTNLCEAVGSVINTPTISWRILPEQHLLILK
jgi:CheY-like chemotaxis protein